MRKTGFAALALFAAVLAAGAAAPQKIYWGDSFPQGWNGSWPARLQTVPEKTGYVRTASSVEVLEFIDTLRWSSEDVAVFSMFTTPLRRTCPVAVLAHPRVATPEEAAKTGKTVVYLEGNIHPYEPEAKEALMMLMREILLGRMKRLLDSLIIIVCPNFNVDGNDSFGFNEGTPHLVGSGVNSQNLNLNRDAVRVDTPEVAGLYRTVFNRWDPILIYDGHLMGRVQHGYAIGYINCTVPAAAPGPRDYVFDKLFPAIREATRADYGLEVFTHAGFDAKWPPTTWSPDAAIYTNEAKFIVNAYGLRNRMSILAETPGHESFERRIYAHYSLMAEVLAYAAAHGQEMQEVCRAADRDVVERVKAQAETGTLKNYLAGKYESRGKIDVLGYQKRNISELIPGTSVRGKMAPHMLEAPEVIHGVEDVTRVVGTTEAAMPRGYIFPAEFDVIADKLRLHNIKVEVLAKPVRAAGEEFVIDRLGQRRTFGDATVTVEGGFVTSPSREFPAGSFRVDLAQPMANAAFYYLEPQAADGFVGSGLFDKFFKEAGAGSKSVAYPVFKYYKILE